MSFLLDNEISSLKIANMTLHVVGNGVFTPQPARVIEHEEFFIERIRDTNIPALFEFHPQSRTKGAAEDIAKGAVSFEAGSQALSHDFSRFHDGNSRDGAFFIFELSTDDPSVKVFSLIKYDYQEVIERAEGQEGDLLRLILQAFVVDKRAIQKAALIRVRDGVADQALAAKDRVKPSPDIGDYFAHYLDVKRSLSDEDLNKKALDVLRNAIVELKDIVPKGDAAQALRHAQSILHDRQQVTEDAIQEAVLAAAGDPQEETLRSRIQKCVQRKIKTAKLEGISFPTNKNVLRKPPLRRLQTTEGVTIIYPDHADKVSVSREKTPAGGEVITVTTKKVTEDKVVPDKTRKQAG